MQRFWSGSRQAAAGPERRGGHMMGSSACAGVRSQLGVYLTGAIAPSDRARLVRHLTGCKDCRAELAGLAALPALLRRPPSRAAVEAAAADPEAEEAAAGPEPGEALLSRTLRRTARRRRRRRRRLLLAAVALVLAAAAGAVWLLRPAGPPGTDPDRGETVLRTTTVGGTTVLTDGEGYTLYWFGRDTATKSACQASCARRWPPVTGPAFEAIGVSGAVGEIVRPDGSLQVTYDGHPLYTTTADTGPGQTRGNGVWSHGGEWHEVTVPGRGG
jgi:predicted lipoprotein with Yx(FWY)xxD motif